RRPAPWRTPCSQSGNHVIHAHPGRSMPPRRPRARGGASSPTPGRGAVSATPVLHRLYVTGRGPRSEAAVAAVRSMVGLTGPEIEIEVVDVTEAPGEAEAAGILLTPTLVRPGP